MRPPFFEDLAVGARFEEAPSLTLTEGHAALHQAICGDQLRLALDRTLGAAVLVAARAAGIQAIDGPHLQIRDDEPFRTEVAHARALGYDGKWAIHPAQLGALREAFTPTEAEVADARKTLAALEAAAAEGAGAVASGDRMLDEALAVSARRVLAQAGERA